MYKHVIESNTINRGKFHDELGQLSANYSFRHNESQIILTFPDVDPDQDKSAIEILVQEIETKITGHDPTPVEPPISQEEQRIQDLENIVADIMMGGM